MRALRNVSAAILVVFSVQAASPASAQHPTYQSLFDQVARDTNCKRSEFSDFVLFYCEATLTYWYFTKPNHPAHPGVIKRSLVQQPDGSWVANENGSSLGPDSTQPAFKAWLAQVSDLDRQMREEIEKQHGAEQSKPPH